ncbi:MAG: esterase-like activity of phytase family protein [Sphingomonas sp.]
MAGFVVLSETTRWPGRPGRAALRFVGDPTESSRGFAFSYVPPDGYDPSDMTELRDGRLVVLNRRATLFGGFTAKLVLVDPAAIWPGAIVGGRVIATLGAPLTRDNFEALAATHEGAATILWIATDDNLEWFEQSLLMKFRLDLPEGR